MSEVENRLRELLRCVLDLVPYRSTMECPACKAKANVLCGDECMLRQARYAVGLDADEHNELPEGLKPMIEPNAQTDLAVAKVAGIDAAITEMVGGVCALCTFRGNVKDFTRVRGEHTGKLILFSPTTDIRDAWEAFGKLSYQVQLEVSSWLSKEIGCETFYYGFPKVMRLGPIAICEAILAVVKAKEES